MPSLMSRIATRLGYVPQALARVEADAAAQRAAQAAASRAYGHAAAHQRNLLAALTTPDVASWQEDGAHINTVSSAGLAVVRARSRAASHNNEFARRFLGMVSSNVLGPFGVRYQSRLRTADGTLRKAENDALEGGWSAFGRRGAFDVTGRYSRREFDRLALRRCAVDGECFVRFRPGRGPHGVQVQLFSADAVPLTYSADLRNGRKIRQGVEFDADGAVVAYHFRTDDTTLDIAGALSASSNQRLLRVPAAEVVHVFLPEEPGQLRGVPWMQAALKRMYQAADFSAAGLNKARESAKRGGFIEQSPDADPLAGEAPGRPGDAPGEGQAQGKAYSSLIDGTWERLAMGETAKPFESDYPNIEYGQFIKDCTRGIASALDVAYITLGNDLSDVNYSSGQLGLEGERTMWLGLQEWWIDLWVRPLHARWLSYALLAAPQLSALRFNRLDEYAEAGRFLGHRWNPLDPLKTIEAQRSRIEARLTSPQRVIAESGEDPDEIVAELQEWQAKTASLAPPPGAATPAPAAPAADPAEAARQRRLQLIASRAID